MLFCHGSKTCSEMDMQHAVMNRMCEMNIGSVGLGWRGHQSNPACRLDNFCCFSKFIVALSVISVSTRLSSCSRP